MNRTLLFKRSAFTFLSILALSPIAFGQLTLTTNQTNVLCNGDASGSATVIPANGTNHYSYSWSPSGGTNATSTGLTAGTYTVTVIDTVSTGATVETLYTQGFEGAHGWTLNVSTGPEGADPNFWTVSDNEGGVAAGGCGVATNGNKSLHITSVFFPTGGASYDAGGLCGLLFCPQTSRRAESPAFSTLNHTGTTLEFDFISNGDALNDNASVYYNSGAGWQLLTASIKSSVCGGGQGLWTHYNVALPASCDNKAAVQVAINWVNNDDGVGTDPSVAINDVLVKGSTSGSPVYDTQTANVIITEPAALSSNLIASGCGSYTLNGQTYIASGPYTQVVQNANGCDSTINLTLTINPLPGTGITATDAVTLMSQTNGVSYTWINCANNQAVPNGSSQSYIATANGSYAVITNNGTCSDTSNCLVINQVGLTDYEDQMQFTIYPNPATDYLTVSFQNAEQVQVRFYNIDGKQMLSKENVQSGDQLVVDQLAAGVYFIELTTDQGSIKKQFIKK